MILVQFNQDIIFMSRLNLTESYVIDRILAPVVPGINI